MACMMKESVDDGLRATGTDRATRDRFNFNFCHARYLQSRGDTHTNLDPSTASSASSQHRLLQYPPASASRH